ncbi:hypothetical protein [Streptomyces sp. H27-S2]|uniref:hypothetical protein n=1 Tax=Streptomyces antarcticus TaxID=2996458 RepID=UPI00226D6EF7|nr:hypothetical protein [Streptomyces sp. H27-S2]MCY0950036.1 hypothetical protein [Streptomyces sp. H27-S2]
MAGNPTQPTSRTRSWWGWGWADAHPGDAECAALGALLPGTLARPLPVPRVGDLGIGDPSVEPPRSLAHLVTADPGDRAAHAMGKAYRDVQSAPAGIRGPRIASAGPGPRFEHVFGARRPPEACVR